MNDRDCQRSVKKRNWSFNANTPGKKVKNIKSGGINQNNPQPQSNNDNRTENKLDNRPNKKVY